MGCKAQSGCHPGSCVVRRIPHSSNPKQHISASTGHTMRHMLPFFFIKLRSPMLSLRGKPKASPHPPHMLKKLLYSPQRGWNPQVTRARFVRFAKPGFGRYSFSTCLMQIPPSTSAMHDNSNKNSIYVCRSEDFTIFTLPKFVEAHLLTLNVFSTTGIGSKWFYLVGGKDRPIPGHCVRSRKKVSGICCS
jgi:hypothetical protein